MVILSLIAFALTACLAFAALCVLLATDREVQTVVGLALILAILVLDMAVVAYWVAPHIG